MCVLPEMMARMGVIPWLGAFALHIVFVRTHFAPLAAVIELSERMSILASASESMNQPNREPPFFWIVLRVSA